MPEEKLMGPIGKFTTFEAIFASLPRGWLWEQEARLLWNASKVCSGPILEVGCHHGRSTCLLASHGRQVYCVDPFIGVPHNENPDNEDGDLAYRSWKINTKHLDNVYVYKMKVEEWNPMRAGFCYLDGDHTFCGTVHQIEKALDCRPEAIAIHDLERGSVSMATVFLGKYTEKAGNLGVWREPRKRI